MIVICDEIENKILRELLVKEADVILVRKDDNQYWIAKNKFGKQSQIPERDVILLVDSYLRLKNP